MNKPIRILVVDDDDGVRVAFAEYLQTFGYETVEACNGRDGLEQFFKNPSDIVLTDLMMPILDGFGVVQELSQQFPRLPLIVISGLYDINDAIKALRLGAWDYITKPVVSMEVIELTIKRVLERRGLMDENHAYRNNLEQQVLLRNKQLLESEERYRQLFLQHEDAVILCSAQNFQIVEINPAAAKLFGYTMNELVDRYVADLFAVDSYQVIQNGLSVLHGKEPIVWEKVAAIKKGQTPLAISCKGWLVNLEGKPLIYLSMRDMGEKIRLEEEMAAFQGHLIQANKMASLGMLVSGMAHEINNPNNFISVNADLLSGIWSDAAQVLLQDSAVSPPLGGLPYRDAISTAEQLIAGIARGSQRIASVVSGLKDYSKSACEKQKESVDILKVVNDARTILDHHIQGRTDNFKVRSSDNLPLVRGNHQQLEQVVINLIVNALQALQDRNGIVVVDIAYHADELLLTVMDTGCGMRSDVLQRVTEPFFSTRLSEGGTGLGLSISSSIVREHGGKMIFESTPGEGTKVIVSLPAVYDVTEEG